jgi:hypothetical protein
MIRISCFTILVYFDCFQVFVPLVTLFLTYLLLVYAESDSLANLIPALIFTGLLSYFVTSMFVGVFGMAISTILVCYIADEEMFPPEDRFCDGPLKGAIKKTAQAASDTQVVAVQPKHNDNKVRMSITANLTHKLIYLMIFLGRAHERSSS